MKYLWIHKEKRNFCLFFLIHSYTNLAICSCRLSRQFYIFVATPTKGWHFLFCYQCCYQPASRWKTGGTSMVVQWLRLCASKAAGIGSIPDLGTKIHKPHGAAKKWKMKKRKKKKKNWQGKLKDLGHRTIIQLIIFYENSLWWYTAWIFAVTTSKIQSSSLKNLLFRIKNLCSYLTGSWIS